MEVQGKIKIIGEVKEFGANGFRKAELILDVTENTDYPQFVNVEFTQDATGLLTKFKEGDDVKIVECKPFSKKKTWEVIDRWSRYKQN